MRKGIGDARRVIVVTWDAGAGGWERLAELEGRERRTGLAGTPFSTDERARSHSLWINEGVKKEVIPWQHIHGPQYEL